MRTKNISNIITKGTVKQRLSLLFSHYALMQYNKPGILTQSEITKLKESIRTSEEIDLYNKYLALNNSVIESLLFLNQVRLAYREQIAYINGYVMIIHLTDILPNNVKETFKVSITAETDITLHDIDAVIAKHKKNAEEYLVMAKSYIKALKEYIEENKFNIEEYNHQIHIIENDLMEDKAIMPKYSRIKVKEALGEMGDKEDKIKIITKDYYPDYDSIKLDDAMYKFYREKYLNE